MIMNDRKPSARLGWPGRTGVLAAVLVAAVLAVAGCSGSSGSANSSAGNGSAGNGSAGNGSAGNGASSSGGTGNGGAGSTSSGSAKLVQFAQCMRAHGMSNFPDPTAEGAFNLPAGTTSTPQFQAADQACKSLAPPGALSGQAPTTQQLNQTVKFVSCMRKHGEPGFPDPSANGTFQLNGGPNPIDPKSPQFLSAMSACRTLLPPGAGFGAGS